MCMWIYSNAADYRERTFYQILMAARIHPVYTAPCVYSALYLRLLFLSQAQAQAHAQREHQMRKSWFLFYKLFSSLFY